MKPLKFDPIRLENCLIVQPDSFYQGCVAVSFQDMGGSPARCATAKDTAALIAALQVAHKAQVEAETLTFADLSDREFFRRADGFDQGAVYVKTGSGYVLAGGKSSVISVGVDHQGMPVIRVRATFEDEKP